MYKEFTENQEYRSQKKLICHVLVLKTIFYSLAALVRKILFSPLEDKTHIFAPPCNILYILIDDMTSLYAGTFIYGHTVTVPGTYIVPVICITKVFGSHTSEWPQQIYFGVAIGRIHIRDGKLVLDGKLVCCRKFLVLDAFPVSNVNSANANMLERTLQFLVASKKGSRLSKMKL
jgi:hypothetical protein